MARITAPFKNCPPRTIKNSRRAYSHAWAWTATTAEGVKVGNSGFCGSYALGLRASAADFNFSNDWRVKDGRSELRNFEFEIVQTVIDTTR